MIRIRRSRVTKQQIIALVLPIIIGYRSSRTKSCYIFPIRCSSDGNDGL